MVQTVRASQFLHDVPRLLTSNIILLFWVQFQIDSEPPQQARAIRHTGVIGGGRYVAHVTFDELIKFVESWGYEIELRDEFLTALVEIVFDKMMYELQR